MTQVLNGNGYAAVDVSTIQPGTDGVLAEFRTIGDIVLGQLAGAQMNVNRSWRHVAEAPSESIKLAFIDGGRAIVTQDGRESYLEKGDFTLVDSTRPHRASGDMMYKVRVFQFPKASLGIPDRDLIQLTATPLRQEHALSAYLIPFLGRLSSPDERLHPQTRMQLARNVTDILATLISDHLQDMPLEDAARRTLVLRIKSFIVDHLDDVNLSPELIATAHHISVRYVHKVFASEEITVSRYILSARLDRCRRDLASHDPNSTAIFGVARQWGFSSAAHFSRAFRTAFGMTPREWQAVSRSEVA